MSTNEPPQGDPMTGVYKLAISALATLMVIFGTYYINAVEADTDRAYQSVQSQIDKVLEHEQRITTLEESKRNTEQILREIKDSIKRVEDALTRR